MCYVLYAMCYVLCAICYVPQFMLKINGQANINAITQALSANVPRVVYISTLENNLPDFILTGYFKGKRMAEQELLHCYPEVGSGVVLRPGFIYGTRVVPSPGGDISLPLGLLGKPLSMLFASPLVDRIRTTVPGMLAPLAVPLSVEAVARAAVEAAMGTERALRVCGAPQSGRQNVLNIADIESLNV
jgi:nucleoside-diphosphate-sugar epimerase